MDDPVGLLVHARIAEQVAAIRRLDPEVRQDLPEAIHQFRVALRRLRTALITYRSFLDRDITDPIGLELKWLGGRLSLARDAEVQADRLSPLGDEIARELARRYRLAHDHAVEALDTERYSALLVVLMEVGASPPWTPDAQAPISEVIPQQLEKDWKRIAARVEAARLIEDEAVRAEHLHDVRKAAKRARYAAEPLVPLGSETARRTTMNTKRIQALLGEHQDTFAARAVLKELISAELSDPSQSILKSALAHERPPRHRSTGPSSNCGLSTKSS